MDKIYLLNVMLLLRTYLPSYTTNSQPVWPDFAKFRNFGKKFKMFDNFLSF